MTSQQLFNLKKKFFGGYLNKKPILNIKYMSLMIECLTSTVLKFLISNSRWI